MFPRLHAIAFKLWAPKTKNEHWGTSNPALAYKKLAEMLQEWTCTVHDRGLPSGPVIGNLSPGTGQHFHCGHVFDPLNSVFLY